MVVSRVLVTLSRSDLLAFLVVGETPRALQVSKFELTVLAFFDSIHPHGHCLLQ